MVYTFGTSKGYVEKEPSISLETLALLEKRGSGVKQSKKECQISEMSCTYPRKLRGNMAIIDQSLAVNEKLESLVKDKESPSHRKEEAGQKEPPMKLNIGLIEKFIVDVDLSEPRQPQAPNRNFFKVGNCYQCKKRKFVFQSYANYMPQSCQKTFCAECLKTYYGEDIYEIIQTRTHWSTPFKRKICKTPSAILSTDTTGCKPENQTEEEERQYVVDTYLKSLTKKTLELNSTLIKKLERNRGTMTTEEKMLGLKVIHDNLETLLDIKGALFNLDLVEKLKTVEKTSYTDVINRVSADLRKRVLDERAEKYQQMLGNEHSEHQEASSEWEDLGNEKGERDVEGQSLGKRDPHQLPSLTDEVAAEGRKVQDRLPSYRSNMPALFSDG
jgi:hypothetical protein